MTKIGEMVNNDEDRAVMQSNLDNLVTGEYANKIHPNAKVINLRTSAPGGILRYCVCAHLMSPTDF